MNYKLHNSNTLKSVPLSEDTNIIFELNKTNNKKVFLNTLLYASQYVCPISFSLIQNRNSTTDIGFGAGAVLDFMYEINSVTETEIKLKHPTGEEESFVKSDIVKEENNQTNFYYLSTTSSNYIIKTINSFFTYLTYYAGDFKVQFECFGETPFNVYRFSKNKKQKKGWITVFYNSNGKIISLINEATQQEIVDFEYTNKCSGFVVSKKFDETNKTQINKITLDYSNGKLRSIKEILHDKNTPIRHTSFVDENDSIIVKNEISGLESHITLTQDAVSLIRQDEDILNVTYIDNYQTNLSIKDNVTEYHFDGFENLCNIKKSDGTIVTSNFNKDGRKQLLSNSSALFVNVEQNFSNFVKHTQSSIEKSSTHSFTSNTDTNCPAGTSIYHLVLNNTSTNPEYFKFKFAKNGGRHNVENIFLWYKMTSLPSSCSPTDILASINLYDSAGNIVENLIVNEPIHLNTMQSGKWALLPLSVQAAKEYSGVELKLQINKTGYELDVSVSLLSDSFVNIIKYDEYGKVCKTLTGREISNYKYNEDNQLKSSDKCFVSYDDYGKPTVIVNSNNIIQEIIYDKYSNVLSQKKFNKDTNEHLLSSSNYLFNEKIISANDVCGVPFDFEYDTYYRLTKVSSCNKNKTITYSTEDDVKYGLVNKLMHNYVRIEVEDPTPDYMDDVMVNYIDEPIQGSQTEYNDKCLVVSEKNLNSNSTSDYQYTYEYDNQNRLTKLKLGNVTIAQYSYSTVNDKIVETTTVGTDTITYNYDNYDRIETINISSGTEYTFEYFNNDEINGFSSLLKRVKNNATNEMFEFEYKDGMLANQIYKSLNSTQYNTKNTYNESKNLFLEKNYQSGSLVSINKYTDSSLNDKKDSISKLESDLINKEYDDLYIASYVKRVANDGIDISKYLFNEKTGDIKINANLADGVEVVNDLLPYLNFDRNSNELTYSFGDSRNEENDYSTFGTHYSISFGFKILSSDTDIPVLRLRNFDNYFLNTGLQLNISQDHLTLSVVKQNENDCETLSSETFSITNGFERMNYLTLNIAVDKSNILSYVIEIYLNAKFVGNVLLTNITNLLSDVIFMQRDSNKTYNCKINTLIIRKNHFLSTNDIEEIHYRIKDIEKNNALTLNRFTKKTRLSKPTYPIIYFDNNFKSIDDSTKPYKFLSSIESKSFYDNFMIDRFSNDVVLQLKGQTLIYDFNLNEYGIVGARFKKVEGKRATIISMHDSTFDISLFVDEDGTLKVKAGSTTSTLGTLDSAWNNFFIKWLKISEADKLGRMKYTFYIYRNSIQLSSRVLNMFEDPSNVLVSFGKDYGSTSVEKETIGYISKAIGVTDSYSVSQLNGALEDNDEYVINRYNDFNLKVSKGIVTKDSNGYVSTSYTYQKENNRVFPKIIKEDIMLSSGRIITNSYSYTTDNLISSVNTSNNVDGNNIQKAFSYDNKNQVTGYFDGENAYEYIYDDMGNVTNIKRNETSIYNAIFKDGILIDEVKRCKINSVNGYPTSKSVNGTIVETYSWDGGKLSQVEYLLTGVKIKFEYAGNGLRTTKREYRNNTIYNTTKYYYNSQGLLVYETRTLNNTKLEYLYDVEGNIYGVYHNGVPYYYVTDALNNINYLADQQGNIVTEIKYDGIYGRHTIVDVNSVGSNHISYINPFRYKGYYYDVETGLFWLSSRYYSPELCRFISPDSVDYLDPSSINGLNLYSYCGNDPINRYDPSGHFWDYVLDAVFIGIGIYDFVKDPSWSKGLWLAADVVLAVLPFVPALSSARHLGKIDNVIDAASALNKIDNVNDAVGGIKYADDAQEIGTYLLKNVDGDVIYVGKGSRNRMMKNFNKFNADSFLYYPAKNIEMAFANEAYFMGIYGGAQSMMKNYRLVGGYERASRLLNKINSPGLRYLFYWF